MLNYFWLHLISDPNIHLWVWMKTDAWMLEKWSYLCSNSAHPRQNQVSRVWTCMYQTETLDAQERSLAGDLVSSRLEGPEGWGDWVQSAASPLLLCSQRFVHSVADRGIHQSGYSISYHLCRHQTRWRTHQCLLKKGKGRIGLWASREFWCYNISCGSLCIVHTHTHTHCCI